MLAHAVATNTDILHRLQNFLIHPFSSFITFILLKFGFQMPNETKLLEHVDYSLRCLHMCEPHACLFYYKQLKIKKDENNYPSSTEDLHI